MKNLDYIESEPLIKRKFLNSDGSFAGKRATVKYLTKKDKNTWKYLCDNYDIDENVELLYLSELCYRIAFDINEAPRCPVCNKIIPYKKDHPYRQMFCSKSCRTSHEGEEICKHLRELTNLERYGVIHPSQTEEIKNKMKETMNKRYGVDWYTQMPDFIEKVKLTNKERYGVEWYTSSDEYKKRSAETNLKRYGVEHPSQSPEIKDKVKQTCQLRYSSNSVVESQHFKNVCLERYGVDNYSKLQK